MNFSEYQNLAKQTADYPDIAIDNTAIGADDPCVISTGYVYPALGLCGEAGEVAEKIKKIIRNKEGYYTPEDVIEIKKELGDVLWYVAAICSEFKLSMDDVAIGNTVKLLDRMNRGVIKSQGDNR